MTRHTMLYSLIREITLFLLSVSNYKTSLKGLISTFPTPLPLGWYKGDTIDIDKGDTFYF